MTTTLAGKLVTSFALTIPRVGLWSAEVEVDDDTVLSGAVDLVIEGRTWRGVVHRGGVELARGVYRVVGAGALLGLLGPQAWRDTTLLEVLRETVRAAGVELAADLGDLSAVVTHWHRRAAPGTHTVAAVAEAAGFAWRALADGTLWSGVDAWDLQILPAELVELLDAAPSVGRYELAGEAALDVLPGRTVAVEDHGDVRVGLVEHRQHGAALRTVIYSERAEDVGAGAGRLRAAFAAIVRAEMRRVDFHALYPATVLSQDGAGGPLDLRPDTDAIAPPQAVPLRTVNGVKLTIPAGARVLLGYEGGDPSKPYAVLGPFADVTRFAVNGATTRAAREGDDVTASAELVAWMASVTAKVNTLPGTPTTTAPTVLGTISEGSDVVRIPRASTSAPTSRRPSIPTPGSPTSTRSSGWSRATPRSRRRCSIASSRPRAR